MNEEPASQHHPDQLAKFHRVFFRELFRRISKMCQESPLQNRTPEQLAELAGNPDQLTNVRAEVLRRLKNDPRKANFLTFRWLLPADEQDKADAYDGLIACCWRAMKMRMRIPYGLFPRGYADTKQGDGYRAGGIAQETREAIKDALVHHLYELRDLAFHTIILTALNGGFHTDAEVGEALRRKVRNESPYLFEYGSDVVGEEYIGNQGVVWNRRDRYEITLFDVVPDNPNPKPVSRLRRLSERPPGEATEAREDTSAEDTEDRTQFVVVPVRPRTNVYNAVLRIITQEKAQIVQEFGEKGWTAFEDILELVDNDAVCLAETGNSQNDRDFERSLTVAFEQVYGVKERQARTHKTRFLALIKRILNAVQENEGLRKSTPEELRAQSVFLPPVVPMEVIQRTSGMPVWTRWTDERSSVGRDVPPDEYEEIKARWEESKARLTGESLNGESDCESDCE